MRRIILIIKLVDSPAVQIIFAYYAHKIRNIAMRDKIISILPRSLFITNYFYTKIEYCEIYKARLF